MNRCVDCCNLDLCSKYNGYTNEYWCDKSYVEGWKKPTQRACDSFTEAYGRSSSEKDNAIRGISDGCFIVTMVYSMLGMDENRKKNLEEFKKYKRDYLMPQKKLYNYLLLYETLGVAIADRIRRQENRQQIAKNLDSIYFPEILKDIRAGKNAKAFKKYVNVVTVLAQGCNFDYKKFEPEMVYTKKY